MRFWLFAFANFYGNNLQSQIEMQQRHLKQSRKQKVKLQVKPSLDHPIANQTGQKKPKKQHGSIKKHSQCVQQGCSARLPVKAHFIPLQKNQSSRASIRKQSASLHVHPHQINSPGKAHKSIKKSGSKKKTSKKLEAYLTSKMAALNPSSYLDTTKSLNPQNHDFVGPHSILIAQMQQSGKNVHKIDSQSFFDSEKEQISMQKMPSQVIKQIPQSYQEFYEESRAVEQNLYLSRKEWEVVETLKLRNEELNHYILELEQAEQKLITKHEQSLMVMRKQFTQKCEAMSQEIQSLTRECSRLSQTNAGLQELFNDSRQQIDLKQNCINQLNQRISALSQHQPSVGATKQEPNYQIQVLTQQLKRMKVQCQSLVGENRRLQANLSSSQIEKQKIRQNAADALSMLRQMGASK